MKFHHPPKSKDTYRFGIFDLVISWDSELSHFISRLLEKYKINYFPSMVSVPHIHISLEDFDDSINEGWSFSISGSLNILKYTRDGIAFYIQYSNDLQNLIVKIRDMNSISISLGIQYAVLISLSQNCVGLHGVTVITGDRSVILSAPSGTGKTTLSNLLRVSHQAAIINGDFALLHVNEIGVFYEPTPFCGSSKVCLNYRLPIDRIVFLEQSASNIIEEFDTRNALKHMLSNCFVPNLDAAITNYIHSTIAEVVKAIPINGFSFKPNQEAAKMLQEYIIT